jgi:hypothetical protein
MVLTLALTCILSPGEDFHVHDLNQLCDVMANPVAGISKGAETVSPSPWGEGWGEGESKH